ncbi:unnamed protein product [Rhizophagus irregularis]|nr:unnamed protein product [Rhizophagus irregularis]
MGKNNNPVASAEHQTVGMGQVLVERFESVRELLSIKGLFLTRNVESEIIIEALLYILVLILITVIFWGSGYRYAIRKWLLQIGELIIEAIFDNIEYNESDISKSHCPEHIPKDLIDA